jgi:phenylacetate-CoA ligase
MQSYYPDEFIETLPREELSQIQLRKFQLMLDTVLTHNAFYRRKLHGAGISSAADIRTFDDYRRIPFLLKSELTADQEATPPYGTNLTFPLGRYSRIHQTSGTTGEPLQLLDTDESWQWWARCWHTVYRAAGVSSNDRIFYAFSFGPFIGFWSAHEGACLLGALQIPGGGMSSLQRLKAILTHQVTVLICTPTYALHLAEVANEYCIDIRNSSVHTTIHAGEPGAGLPGTRNRIEDAWGAKCYDHAGATEVGAWGFEGETRNGLYVNEGEFIFEVIDPDSGRPDTEGELVISNLGRIGMPVIRYRTGDHVKLSQEPYDGGITYRKLDGGVIGRVDDVLVVRGINVYPSAVENILRRFPEVVEFAVDIYRRHELDDMEIRTEVGKNAESGLADAISAAIRDALGLRVTIEVVPSGILPRFDMKARRFTDHRA